MDQVENLQFYNGNEKDENDTVTLEVNLDGLFLKIKVKYTLPI
jgi:hypothetical protein